MCLITVINATSFLLDRMYCGDHPWKSRGRGRRARVILTDFSQSSRSRIAGSECVCIMLSDILVIFSWNLVMAVLFVSGSSVSGLVAFGLGVFSSGFGRGGTMMSVLADIGR